MSQYEDLLRQFVKIDNKDLAGFFFAKAQTIEGYSKQYSLIWDLVETLMCKVIVLDKMDKSEYAVIQALAVYRHGRPFDPDEFASRLQKFVENNADTTVMEFAFSMLPEFVRDDVVMILMCLAAVDGGISNQENEWLSTLCF